MPSINFNVIDFIYQISPPGYFKNIYNCSRESGVCTQFMSLFFSTYSLAIFNDQSIDKYENFLILTWAPLELADAYNTHNNV